MESLEQILCMDGGDGDSSYATNSIHQREVMLRSKKTIEETLTKVQNNVVLTKCLNVADLGCASGPIPLLFVKEVMNIIGKNNNEMMHEICEVQVFLNDLPSNDFKEIFKLLPELYLRFEEENKGCFVAAVPGSFYGRLFPSNSMHFVHSSYALHWLSQVPRGLIDENGEVLNKGNICLTESSGPLVHKLYYEQFEKDFQLFLKSRSQEMVAGGGMVLTIASSDGVKHKDSPMDVIGFFLYDLADEGLVEKSQIDMFNTHVYQPSAEEIKRIIKIEGSFEVTKLESFNTSWDAFMPKDLESEVTVDVNRRAKFIANVMKAGTRPLLAAHFGEDVVEELFRRLPDKFAENMKNMDCTFYNVVVSLEKMWY